MYTFRGCIPAKLPQTGTSIFAIMTRMANEHNAINLSQGFPDFAIDPQLTDLVYKCMKDGYNQYAPMTGLPELLNAIAEKTNFLYSAIYDPATEITVTTGATQAIYTAIASFVSENDEVIIFEPAYDSYIPAVKLAGGVPVTIPLSIPGYQINWESVKGAINHRTRMIIINSPHNPTGSILSHDDMVMLASLTKDSGIIILSDEVYEHIIFDGRVHQSVCRYPDLADRSLVMCSFGKTFHATGWKIGYCLGPSNLMKEFRKTHQFVVFTVNTPMQKAIAMYLQDRTKYLHLGSFYQEKRDYFINLLKSSRFQLVPSAGTYFQILDYSQICDDPEFDFAVHLTRKFGVASVPNSYFYSNPQNNRTLRFCFAKNNDTLEKAAEILCRI